jgi:miniconductance mechanosensitive channel
MNNLIETWFHQLGMSAAEQPIMNSLISSLLILILSALSYYIARSYFLKSIKIIITKTKNTWDDLFLQHKVFTRAMLLVPFIVILVTTPRLLPADSAAFDIFILLAKIAICFQVANTINSTLNVVKSLYRQTARERYIPLNSAIQMLKLAVYLVATILALSYIIGRSPIYLLSGLGALTAVLLLVFQDTIKGLVASIQISANRMVAPGDWVEIPQYGADGDVIEIGLSSVKIQNFDKTITTVPTYALISGSFKNWRDMFNSGGRRIKRSIVIDLGSIGFCDKTQIEGFRKIALLSDYLAEKTADITQSNVNKKADDNDLLNARQLTNIGTFRAYIDAYLQQHDKVHHELTCMVRQLSATATGLPLELYFFSNDQNWENYEGIQADIFDHLFAMAPQFNLRIFQHPTGHDWSKHS